MDELYLITRMENGEEKVLAELFDFYIVQYKKVIWSKNWYFPDEVLHDNFQDAVIDLYQNVRRGKYQKQAGVSLKGYLFDIGIKRLINRLEKEKIRKGHADKVQAKSESWGVKLGTENQMIGGLVNEKLRELVAKLPPKCRQILTLFYFEEKKIKEIKEIMAYESDDVVKSRKLKCFKRLKAEILARYDKDDFL